MDLEPALSGSIDFILAAHPPQHSNNGVTTPHPYPDARTADSASAPQPLRFRFGLRSLMLVMAAVGVLSGLARSVVQGDPALAILFKSLAVFCYGGIIAIPGYAFVAALLTLSTKTTWGQRAG